MLYRINAQSEAYEQALADAGVPYVVRGGERFFERPEVRAGGGAAARRRPGGRAGPDARCRGGAATCSAAVGWRLERPPPAGGAARETVGGAGGARRPRRGFVAAARPDADLPAFVAELAERAAAQHAPTVEGVTLASLHAAKGLEWDAVFLVGLADGTLPITYARRPTAARGGAAAALRRHHPGPRAPVAVLGAGAQPPGGRAAGGRPASSPGSPARPRRPRGQGDEPGARARPSAGSAARRCSTPAQRKLGRCSDCPSDTTRSCSSGCGPGAAARQDAKVPAYVVFTDATLTAIAEQPPERPRRSCRRSRASARASWTLYGEDVLALVGGAEPVRTCSAEMTTTVVTYCPWAGLIMAA